MITTAMRRGAAVLLVATIAALLVARWGLAEDARGGTPSPAALEALTVSWRVVAVRPGSVDAGRTGALATIATLPAMALAVACSASFLARRNARPRVAGDVAALGWSERAPPR